MSKATAAWPRVTIVIEPAGGNWSAYSDDVPGCVATGDTPEETLASFKEALAFHQAIDDVPRGVAPGVQARG
jgi:hypothetical protein